MNLKTKTLILATFAGCNICFSQPGYMGKKFSLGYYLEFFPHANLIGNNSPKNEPGFEIEPEHHLNATWVVNRRWELVVDVSRRNRDYTVNRVGYSSNRTMPDGFVYSKSYGEFEEKYLAAMETYWMFAIRKYFKNQIAPVGMYQQFAYVSGSSRFKDESINLTAEYWGGYSFASTSGKETLSTRYKGEAKLAYFSYGLGIKRPIVKYLYGSAECNVQLPLTGWNIPMYSNGGSLSSYLDYHLIKGLEAHNFIDIRLGVGWMF